MPDEHEALVRTFTTWCYVPRRTVWSLGNELSREVYMIIEKGNKVHVIYRALYENSSRRHFLGEVVVAEGSVCRLEGYVFVYDPKSTTYTRKPEKRITIMDLSESGYIVNVIDQQVTLANVTYKYAQGVGLIATDDKGFALNINEFGTKS